MKFDMQAARAAHRIMQRKKNIMTDYDVFAAASWLPVALDRIAELEAALIEERSQWNAICKDIGADLHDRYCTTEDDYPEARKQLHAEGKV